MSVTRQKISPLRRDYNAWVANESLEDYALRYTPRTFRKWSEFRVANTALGAVSFLALEAIGGAIALSHGFENALWAIGVVGLITFLTGLPIGYHAARHGVDMDLLTRGAGFGYLGSTLTSLIYASFTFIFFALEATIMGLALQMLFGWPLPVCHVVASLVIVPMVVHGITFISRLQGWTQPLWLLLLWTLPFLAVLVQEPQAFREFTSLSGRLSGQREFSPLAFGMACTVAFSLIVQVGEQVDYLRFLPEKTSHNRWRWWGAVLVAGPGWIVPGMLKMLAGAFLAFLVLQSQVPAEKALEPTQMYLAGFSRVFDSPAWATAATVLFVIVSQLKINVTNAYAGSLAWSNFFARLTHSHPGRVVWLVFNVLIAVLLMTLGVFSVLEHVLGLYSNVATAWVGALVADLVINKPLGWSPRGIQFKRAHLYDLNPVGLGAMVLAVGMALVAHSGVLGEMASAWSPFIALGTALLTSPVLARLTRGRFYLARPEGSLWAPGQKVRCSVCETPFESEDMASCPAYGAPICSLCCTLESRCHDRCKSRSRAAEQVSDALARCLPRSWSSRVNVRVGHFLVVFLSIAVTLGFVMGVVYCHEEVLGPHLLAGPFVRVYALLLVASAVCAWWVVLASESRRMAQDDAHRDNHLLHREIDAHRRTDSALQAAKDLAEAANQAKTRYVTGMTHELRTPLNSMLGYAQILLKDEPLAGPRRSALQTIQRSGEHLVGLIDGLLELARIEAGRLRLDPVPFALREFLDEVVRMVAPQAQAKGLAFELVTQGRVPAWVHADARRLRQVLLNLLGNAVRFTDEGRITLRVDARREVLRFEVEDTGIGIAPQDLERIFLPFERGSAGRRRPDSGTGLGLTITHLLSELMGGELRVASTLGQGSVFTVRLCLREISPPRSPVTLTGQTRLRHQPVVGHAGPRRTLLVVDDQPIQRQMLAGLLLPLGFEVREAASGHECLESVQERPPDAVLLDISMDDLDGWETARRLREAGWVDGPIILVSANVFENRPESQIAAGCQAFVAKPVMEAPLLDALQEHLHLQWCFDEPGVLLSDPAPSPDRSLVLPLQSWHTLSRLCAMGHVQGLAHALQALPATGPQGQAVTAELFALLEALDLDGLSARLQALRPADTLEVPHATAQPTAQATASPAA